MYNPIYTSHVVYILRLVQMQCNKTTCTTVVCVALWRVLLQYFSYFNSQCLCVYGMNHINFIIFLGLYR